MLPILITQFFGDAAYKQRQFVEASRHYIRVQEWSEKHEREDITAVASHQLGMIAEEKRDYESAEQWYKKSLEIKERQGKEQGAASSYHQLGIVAQEKRDYESAEQWYKKSLEINERQGNAHGAANSYAQMGLMSREGGKWLESGEHLLQALSRFLSVNDEHLAQSVCGDYAKLCHAAGEENHEALAALWEKHEISEQMSFADLLNSSAPDS